MAKTTIQEGETVNELVQRTGSSEEDIQVQGSTPVAGANVTANKSLPEQLGYTPQQPVKTEPIKSSPEAVVPVAPVSTGDRPPTQPEQFGPETTGGNFGFLNQDGVDFTGETTVRDTNDINRIFNDIRLGKRSQINNPRTPAERQAQFIYTNYQAHKDLDSKGLAQAIADGNITPDKNNVLWTSLYRGGKPTRQQVEAYALWQDFLKQEGPTAAMRANNPVLLGQNIASIEERINNEQEADKKDIGDDIPIIAADEAVEEDGGGFQQFVEKNRSSLTQERLDKAVGDLIGFVDGKPPEPGFQRNLRGLNEEFGTVALEDEVNSIREMIREESAFLRERVNAQKDKSLSLGVIAGRAGEIEKQQRERLDYLGRMQNTAQDSLDSRYKIVGMLQDAYGNDYSATVQNYDREYKQATDSIKMLSGLRDEEITIERQAMTDAQANLNVIYNNLQSGAMDVSRMTPDQKNQIRKLESRAGMPSGSFESIVSQLEGGQMIGNGEVRVDENGIKHMDIITKGADGQISVQSVPLGMDIDALSKAKSAKALADKRDIESQLAEAAVTGYYNGVKTTDEQQREIENFMAQRKIDISKTYADIAEANLQQAISNGASKVEVVQAKLLTDYAKAVNDDAKNKITKNSLGLVIPNPNYVENPALEVMRVQLGIGRSVTDDDVGKE